VKETPPGCVPHESVEGCCDTDIFDPRHVAWHREYMSRDGTTAIGLNQDGTVDEVLVGAADIHIEQMSDQAYWMRIGRIHFWFSYEKGRRIVLTATSSDDA
jgi:hypothetical protein